MNNQKQEAVKIASGSLAVFPSAERLNQAGSNVVSPLRLELTPDVLRDVTKLAFTLTAMPVDFLRPDGRQTGYSVGCFEANFLLNISPGKLALDAMDQVAIEFTGTVGNDHERGVALAPKIEIKAGADGAGAGGELVSYTRKRTARKSATAKANSDDPRTKCFVHNNGGHVRWIMTPSPVLPDPPPLGHSVSVSGEGRWPDARGGQIQVWGRRYVFGDGMVKLSGAGQLKAKFIHWVKTLKIYDDRRPEQFEVVKAA